jgi:hypothetical protein
MSWPAPKPDPRHLSEKRCRRCGRQMKVEDRHPLCWPCWAKTRDERRRGVSWADLTHSDPDANPADLVPSPFDDLRGG